MARGQVAPLGAAEDIKTTQVSEPAPAVAVVETGLPGPDFFDAPIGKREKIECARGFVAVAVPEQALAVYRQMGWVDAFHSSAPRPPGRGDAGRVLDEAKYQVDAGGRLMRDRDYLMIMRDDTHKRLEQKEEERAQEPIRALRAREHGREGRDPDFFSVAYRVEDNVRPMGAAGALVRDDA